MVQRGEDFRFALEPGQPLAVGRHSVGEDLDGDLSLEVGVGGAIDLAHPAHADLRGNFIRAESGARGEGHEVRETRVIIRGSPISARS